MSSGMRQGSARIDQSMNGGVKLSSDFLVQEHLSALLERFPKVGFLLSLDASVPSAQGASSTKWVEELPLDQIDLLYVLGWDLAAYQALKPWLAQAFSRELIFLEEHVENALSFLYTFGAKEAISHLQVHFSLLPQKGAARREEIKCLAKRYPVARLEIARSPVAAAKSKSSFYRLRLDLLRATTLSHALHLDRLHGDRLFANWLANLRQLPSAFYAHRLKGCCENIPAIVCGAGPSLETSLECLRQAESRAIIIAGGSTLAALSAQGIAPHFGMAIDPNIEEYLRFQNTLTQEIPLLFSTRVFPEIFHTWNGPTGYVRAGIGGVPEIWMEEFLGLTDPLLGAGVLSEESISVTNICLAWAQFLGCNPIFLNGIDLAYTEKKRYASGVEDQNSSIEATGVYSAADRFLTRKDRKGHAVHSAVRWVMEGASFSHFAEKHPNVRFFNTTDGGLSLRGIDDLPLDAAMEQFCRREYDLRGRIFAALSTASMAEGTRSLLTENVQKLHSSLERTVEQIGVILQEIEEMILHPDKGMTGRFILAEMELKDEDAYLLLFYDLFQVIEVVMQREWRGESDTMKRRKAQWTFLLQIVHRYVLILSGK